MPEPAALVPSERTRSLILACLLLLGAGAFSVHAGCLELPFQGSRPQGIVGAVIDGVLGITSILAAVGLWKRRLWGWWVGTLSCASAVTLNLFGFISIFAIRASLPPRFKPPELTWQDFRNPGFWLAGLGLLLVLLFSRAVMGVVAEAPYRRLRRGLIAAGVGVGSPILMVGVMAILMFFSTSRTLQKSPFNDPPVDPSTLFARQIGSVFSMTASPDGKFLAFQPVGNHDKEASRLGLLELGSGKLTWVPVPGLVMRMRWSRSGQILAVGCGAGAGVQFISMATKEVVWSKDLPAAHMAFHPDGTLWFLDYDDNTLRAADPVNKTLVHRLLNPCDPVQGFAISPDGGRIALAWGDSTSMSIRILDARTSQVLGTWSDGENPVIDDLRFTGDGKWLLTLHHGKGMDGFVRVWNAATGKMEYELKDLSTIPFDFDPMALSPNGEYLAARSKDGKREIWSLEKRAWIWRMPDEKPLSRLDPGIFSPDSKEFWTKAPFVFGDFKGPQGGLQRWNFLKP